MLPAYRKLGKFRILGLGWKLIFLAELEHTLVYRLLNIWTWKQELNETGNIETEIEEQNIRGERILD